MTTKCKVNECKNNKPRRFVVCSACWAKMSAEMQNSVRDRAERGSYSLRATPKRDWYERASRLVGKIKVPYIVGHGYSAVKVADDKSEAK